MNDKCSVWQVSHGQVMRQSHTAEWRYTYSLNKVAGVAPAWTMMLALMAWPQALPLPLPLHCQLIDCLQPEAGGPEPPEQMPANKVIC